MTRYRTPRASAAGRRTSSRRGATLVRVEWINHLVVEPKRVLPKLADRLMHDLEVQAGEGRAGTGRPLPPLDEQTVRQKVRAGASPVADLRQTGDLWRRFALLEMDDRGFTIGWVLRTRRQILQWRTLAGTGRSPLGTSKRLIRELAALAEKRGWIVRKPGPPPGAGRGQ